MGKNKIKRTLVISGINLYNGGPLSVYKDFLDALIENKYNLMYNVVAFVHKKEIFNEYKNAEIQFIELPLSRRNYLFRFYYEYIYFYFYSMRNNVDIWLSLHDMTPNVKAQKRYVYCHNPSPFLKLNKNMWHLNKKDYIVSKFYKYIYKINIKKNTAVIVQQDWIRQEFKTMYGIKNVIVAKPNVDIEIPNVQSRGNSQGKVIFIYSAYPRSFKNFEVICEACRILKDMYNRFEVILTIDGSENAYSSLLRKEYSDIENIQWLGLVSRDEVLKKYAESNCLIFPSLLETWGLPITEYEAFNKPIIVSDLPYAHETIGNYDKTAFFDPHSSKDLAKIIKAVIEGNMNFKKHKAVCIDKPCANNWSELNKMLF